jgi:hypothetical protein
MAFTLHKTVLPDSHRAYILLSVSPVISLIAPVIQGRIELLPMENVCFALAAFEEKLNKIVSGKARDVTAFQFIILHFAVFCNVKANRY